MNERQRMTFQPTVFIISAPSGSGKTTLVARLLDQVNGLNFSVSYTTRLPRGSERNGESYYFTTRQDFEDRIENGEFLEYASVFGNYYGTHIGELEKAAETHRDLVLDIDVQGAGQLKRTIPQAVTIFVLPPSRQKLEERLRSRSEDPEAVIERRLNDAAREIGNYESYDYVLINDDLSESSKALAGIVRAERVRRTRLEDKIKPILETFAVGAVNMSALKE
jgi:guanylate kinase